MVADFIIDAVIMRDGIGAYLSLLNWLAWAFNYRDEFDARVKVTVKMFWVYDFITVDVVESVRI